VVTRSEETGRLLDGPLMTAGDSSISGDRRRRWSIEGLGKTLTIDHAEAQKYNVAGPVILTALGVAALVLITKEAVRCVPWCSNQ